MRTFLETAGRREPVHLGELEAVVMERLWSWGRAAAVREVLEDLQQDRALAYTTVMTVMDNLRRKGLLVRERDGRAYNYQTVQTREQYTATMMGRTLAAGGNQSVTLLHFLEYIATEDIAVLRDALSENAANRDAGPS
ncbi:UNVERIFIED_ORG: putative transcriptional regulator [Arthrobacter sp. UYCu721]